MGTPIDEAVLPAVADIFAEDVAAPAVIGASEGGAAAGAAAGASYGGAGDYASAAEGASVSATQTAGMSEGIQGLSGAINTMKTVATVLSPIASLAASAAGYGAAKRAGKLTDAPAVAPPVTMPSFGSVDTMNTMRGSIQEQMMRRGRAATILTQQDSGNRLGG